MQDTTTSSVSAEQQRLNQQLSDTCQNMVAHVRAAEQWVLDNPDRLDKAAISRIQTELRKAAITFSKCKTAALRKMCVGVFGPSQAGKSYLISALASPAQGTLMADFCGQQFDFISQINPAGNKESTGLVTRFTTTAPANAPAGAPVHLRLLSEADIICILTNTYYADCVHEDEPESSAPLAILTELDKTTADGTGMSAEAVDELREYVQKHFSPQARILMLKNMGFWERALTLAPRLSIQNRGKLFGCLWNNTPEFTDLYIKLAAALHSIGTPDAAWCAIDALIPREESIIDVAQLHGLQKDTGSPLTVIGDAGKQAALPRSVITALTAELTIYMPQKPDAFFDYTDLLDFPGYRSRLAVADLAVALQGGALDDFFLRGKVAYLFQRYCEERELTSILLCIGDGPQETRAVLAPAVKSWIDAIHGNTATLRTNTAPALFVILTKMDTIFERKAGAPSIAGRWDTRLFTSLLEPFNTGNDPWPGNWDGKPFNNVFLLRNPKIRCDIFSFDEQEKETGIRQDNEAFVAEVKQDFTDSALVQTHIFEPEQAWASAMRLNDGGVQFLREHLRPLCSPDLKRTQIASMVQQWQERIHSQLNAFWVNDDKEKEREHKFQRSQVLAKAIVHLAENQLYGEFLRSLQVRDQELYNLYKQAEQERLQNPDAAPNIEGARINGQDILHSLFGEATAVPEVKEPQPPTQQRRMDRAERVASITIEHWTSRLRALATSEAAQNYFSFPATELRFFVDELEQTMQRTRVPQQMIEALRRASDYGNLAQEQLLWKQASIAADHINAFINWLSFDPRYHSDAERTIRLNEQTVVLFPLAPVIHGTIQLQETMHAYDSERLAMWLRALIYNIIANVDFSEGTTINREQNQRLGKILQDIAPC